MATTKIDTQIMIIDKAICRHIATSNHSARGTVSQDVLSQPQNYIEHIMLKFFAQEKDIDDSYENICKAIKYTSTKGNLKVLYNFHKYLQIVASHYTLEEENSKRLMLKYYKLLLKVQKLVKTSFDMDILNNLFDFPLETDETLQEYYEKIAEKICSYPHCQPEKSDKYYIQKIKPFFVNSNIFYEVTFTPANDYSSKTDRIIAFTSHEITDNYAVKFSLVNTSIELLGKIMPIAVINRWETAIRNCEYKNFSRLIRGTSVNIGVSEQQGLSHFLTESEFNLVDLVSFPNEEFEKVKQQVTNRSKNVVFFEDLKECRRIINSNQPGANLLRYLLFHMNNMIIKQQWHSTPNHNLSNLYAANGCIPFDTMPFISSLVGHNPKLGDLFSCIPSEKIT